MAGKDPLLPNTAAFLRQLWCFSARMGLVGLRRPNVRRQRSQPQPAISGRGKEARSAGALSERASKHHRRYRPRQERDRRLSDADGFREFLIDRRDGDIDDKAGKRRIDGAPVQLLHEWRRAIAKPLLIRTQSG